MGRVERAKLKQVECQIKAKMAQIQKNKTTAHHLRLLKACHAKPHRELNPKRGDARIGFVDFPLVEVNTLLDLPGIIESIKDGKVRGIDLMATCPKSELDAETVKSPLISIKKRDIIYKVPHFVPISTHHYLALSESSENSYQTQRPAARLDIPVVLPYSRTTAENFCMKIHNNLIKEFKYALV
ncbi:unnamed protein product [Nyctereutes procyonoides]|uniref:(raccoon dog) hypothetical protein n=1 Tax=Nyctereutes procyonoides TaxID=34880 RepID=A0A811ZY74_NYCPR|nr:unnamed protein product [Nyctereutes procyonoides]